MSYNAHEVNKKKNNIKIIVLIVQICSKFDKNDKNIGKKVLLILTLFG